MHIHLIDHPSSLESQQCSAMPHLRPTELACWLQSRMSLLSAMFLAILLLQFAIRKYLPGEQPCPIPAFLMMVWDTVPQLSNDLCMHTTLQARPPSSRHTSCSW